MMTAQEAFEQQIIVQIGSAALTIAKQAAASRQLQIDLEAAKAEIEQLKTPKVKKPMK